MTPREISWRWRVTPASRRLSKFSPKDSLFLAKATGRIAHGGGPRLKVGSPEYKTLLAWVEDGAPEIAGKGARGAGQGDG